MQVVKEVKYSKLQYFLWLVAGSEIETLKKCPTDYNRHANIGLMIIMTSLFAGFTGFIAGKTFVKDNILGAYGFALIWSFLIFSLDRSMVNSIKKDPNANEKSLMKYFWPRLILAVILSFFMSIPLDHIVFEEKIAAQMITNANSEELNTLSQYTKALGVNADSGNLKSANKQISELSTKIDKGCTSCKESEYLNAKSAADNLEFNQLPGLTSKFNLSLNQYNSYLSELESSQTNLDDASLNNNARLIALRSNKNKIRDELNKMKSEINSLRQKASAACAIWLEKQKTILKKEEAKKELIENRLDSSNQKIRIRGDQVANTLSEMKGFDTQFVTLFLMPNAGVQILKWLIFLALLVIEILPTYLKLKTPIGQYDWEIFLAERNTELEIKSKVAVFEKEASEIEVYRSKKEIELNKNLIDKVALIEQKLAEEMLIEWEEEAKKTMKNKSTA